MLRVLSRFWREHVRARRPPAANQFASWADFQALLTRTLAVSRRRCCERRLRSRALCTAATLPCWQGLTDNTSCGHLLGQAAGAHALPCVPHCT